MVLKDFTLVGKRIVSIMDCGSTKCYTTAVYTGVMVILSLQLLSTIERQVFDFLGYMWAPIIGNFFQIICTIFGIFGTYQYRPKFIAVYSTWTLVWLGWNIFVICLYLEVGVLNRTRDIAILNIGTRNKSWWLEHGIGCKVNNDTWRDKAVYPEPPPDEFVEGCILDYYYVEVIHAGVQCLLSLTGFVFTCVAIYMFTEEDESSSSANDELEFVKMHTLPPSRGTTAHQTSVDMDVDQQSTAPSRNDYPTLEHPPSYETSMRNAHSTGHYYAPSDRQSVRSKASTRSKSKSQNHERRREDLPWVQITPSSSGATGADNPAFRHFP